LRDAKDIGRELVAEEWIPAFDILHKLGIDFNLILGNETWLLGEDLIRIMKLNKVPYALYTTCPEPTFSKYRDVFFKDGIIDNLSCGIDYPPIHFVRDDSWMKSVAAMLGFNWVKEHYPNVDCQGTITVHKKNYMYVPELVNLLSDRGVFVGINFIHWNKDGNYDFFPKKEVIEDLLFTKEDYVKVNLMLCEVLEAPGLLQNPEFIQERVEMLLNMGWHCGGDPYGGPTIDADGQLRCCGYRRGTRTPKFSIFDLPKHLDEWREAVQQDAFECPGCAWSYPWMYWYWETHDIELGKQVFVKHAGKHIDESKWSKRTIE
jgi:MoaA/NifB/PqqE/SkfB family radical SAM enzyme